MKKILLTFLIIIVRAFLNEKNDNSPIELLNNMTIKSGISKTYFIKYFETTNIFFSIEDGENDSLQVNINSINCNIKINSLGEIINKNNLNTYSIKINVNQNISLEPIPDIIYGKYKENYEKNIVFYLWVVIV